jgi:hypothetical protein
LAHRIIPITVDPEHTLRRVPLGLLRPLQGDLKTLDRKRYMALKTSILEEGWATAVYVWIDEDETIWTIDGHQRLFVAQNEGWEIEGDVPILPIVAATKKDAARKLLKIFSSMYGEIDPQGLNEYMHIFDVEYGTDFEPDALPNFNADHFEAEFLRDPVLPDDDGEPLSLSTKDYGGATSMTRASAPIRYWTNEGLLRGEVLDFGSGQEAHEYEKYDIVHWPDPAVLTKSWDTVMCNYVMNVQPADHLITQLACIIAHLVRPGGKALFAIRNDVKETAETARGTQVSKTADEWQAFLEVFFHVDRVEDASFYGFICFPLWHPVGEVSNV